MLIEEKWTTVKILNWTKEFLLAKGVANARLEAEWLLCAATGLDRIGLYLQHDKPLNDCELAAYRGMVSRRARREPLQHILGSQEFYGLDFTVTPDVLIPRADTEVLVAEAIKRSNNAATILDIGTGSGCVAIALKKQLPNIAVTATDISASALVVAGINASLHNVSIEYLLGNILSPVADRIFDIIVSNPPYIPTAAIETLDQEVRDYDPIYALDGGSDGLDIYRELIPQAIKNLKPGGWLMVEIGFGQSEDIKTIFEKSGGYQPPFIARDQGSIDRVIGAQRKEL